MRILGAYVVVCVGLVVFGLVGDVRPFSLTVYAVTLASVAIVMVGFNVLRLRTLRRIVASVRSAAPSAPQGIAEAPSEGVARLIAQLRALGFREAGMIETRLQGTPPLLGWVFTSEPGTTWAEVGLSDSPIAVFLSQAADGRFLETTTAGGELIDHPALFARTIRGDVAAAHAAHLEALAGWETRTGPARVVRTFADYLEAEAAQRELTGGLRIASFIERAVRPGIRSWAIAAIVAAVAAGVLWGLDVARR